MSEYPITISNLNDFIFCPVSIYFHALERGVDKTLTQDIAQINGSAAHEKSDTGGYSSKRSILQGTPVYSATYNLSGNIDTFDVERGVLTERKKRIKTVYDGYVFQLYAQYFSLIELGYEVSSIRLYSMDDNKVCPIALPKEDDEMYFKFKALLEEIDSFNINEFHQKNSQKCSNCIYEPLCSYSTMK